MITDVQSKTRFKIRLYLREEVIILVLNTHCVLVIVEEFSLWITTLDIIPSTYPIGIWFIEFFEDAIKDILTESTQSDVEVRHENNPNLFTSIGEITRLCEHKDEYLYKYLKVMVACACF